MRLIDADALVDTLSVDPIGCAGCPEPEFMDELIDILDTAPTVEPTGDLISRADAIEAVKETLSGNVYWDYVCDAVDALKALPSAEAKPKENHTQATRAKHVIRSLGTDSISHNGIDCTEFIHWLMEEVMDEEMWKLNVVGNGEIICRKLKKLGLLEVKDGYYILPSPEAVQGEWIPCSERLPETDDEVLAADCADMFVAWYGYDRIWKSTDHNYDPETPILAWMPLPKPYKGGGDE